MFSLNTACVLWREDLIESFFSSWSLFHNAYLAGWLIGLLLSLIGVLVVARDQIFLGAAVSQASTLGIAVGMWLSSWPMFAECVWCRSEVFHTICAGIFAVLAAFITARGGKVDGQETHEALTGWVFLLASSVSILLMAHSPHGLEEVHRLLASTIIGATRADVWLFTAVTIVTGAALIRCYRQILLLIMDPDMARAVGMRVGLWEGGFAIWLGIAIGFSIRVSGVVYTFASLVLPALIAKNLSREVRTMFVLAPTISLAAGVVAFVVANSYDYPPGQMAAACLCILLTIAWALRNARFSQPGR